MRGALRIGSILLAVCGLAASGCEGDPENSTPLLRGEGLALGNSVWFQAPRAESLVRVVEASRSNEAFAIEGEPIDLLRLPGSDSLLCLSRTRRDEAVLTRVRGAAGTDPSLESVVLGANFNRLAVGPTGAFAIAFTDPDVTVRNPGSLNPGEIRIVDLGGAELSSASHTLTYQPVDFLFDPAERYAMVRTVDRMLLLELDPARSFRDHQIPLNASGAVAPPLSLLELSPDGNLVVAVEQGATDLFVISAEVPAAPRIENVVALNRQPTDAVFSPDGSSLLVLYGSLEITVMQTSDMSTDTLDVPVAAQRAAVAEGPDGPFAMLWGVNGSPRLARVELDDLAVDDWGLAAPVRDVLVSPEGLGAVIVHGEHPDAFGVAQPSISLFAFGLRGPSRILLTDTPSEVAFVPGPSGFADAALLLPDDDLLVRYDMATYDAVILDMHAAPLSLGILPESDLADAVLHVVHDQPFGLVSFVDAHAGATPPGGFPAVAGQALVNLVDPE